MSICYLNFIKIYKILHAHFLYFAPFSSLIDFPVPTKDRLKFCLTINFMQIRKIYFCYLSGLIFCIALGYFCFVGLASDILHTYCILHSINFFFSLSINVLPPFIPFLFLSQLNINFENFYIFCFFMIFLLFFSRFIVFFLYFFNFFYFIRTLHKMKKRLSI